MRLTWVRTAASALALAGLAQPALAQTADCVNQADVEQAAIYAMPSLYAGFTARCAASLPTDGFIATRGEAFIAPYRQRQSAAWPGAKALLDTFASSGKASSEIGEISSLLGTMPDEALRPFVDALVQQKLAEDIKLQDCGKVERAIELLSPLPPENTGGLVAMLLDFAGVKNPPLCPYQPK
ncbi:hypothetical protein [Pelagerythrobacter sp.]|uniref:hypothetical protein n=1 Tax=Pelagerythrobacter sp. TaxID=2800702 RepID=UPI0035B4BF2A